jgi:hypothetical protein
MNSMSERFLWNAMDLEIESNGTDDDDSTEGDQGDVTKGDTPGHPFRGNASWGGHAGVLPYVSGRDLTPDEQHTRDVVDAIMLDVPEALDEAARAMADRVRWDDVLVPVPDIHGDTARNLALAEALARETGAEVADVLGRAVAVESSRIAREAGPAGVAIPDQRMTVGSVPDGRVVFVDVLTSSGNTFEAARRAVGRGVGVAYAREVKDAPDAVAKGDVEGHPFRGNQYTDGSGGGDQGGQWFHGTSDESGLGAGDTIDPKMGNFESVVWATSDKAHADRFAKARTVLDSPEAKPVTYAIKLRGDAKIKRIPEASQNVEDDIRSAREDGFDALVIERGENGRPELAILSRGAAHAS